MKKKKPSSKKQCGRLKKINVIDYLKEDIWFEIFTHLPLKLIFQLKLLSKQWYVLISSPNFMTRRLNICTFFYRIRSVHPPLVDYQSCPIVFSLNTDSSECSKSDQDYINRRYSLNLLLEGLLGSSNGWLLFGDSVTEEGPYCYSIFNVLTGKLIGLGPVYESIDDYESHALVFESSSSSTWNTNPTGFKLVRIPEIRIPRKKFYIRIYCSDTGKWKNHKVMCSEKITMLHENTEKVVSDQNGRLYWIIGTHKILTYDLKNNVGASGECMIIDLPKKEEDDGDGSMSSARSCLVESEGFIFYIRIESGQMKFSVWLLEEEKDESNEEWSWKLVHTIRLNEILSGYEWNNTRMNMKPLALSPIDRNIVFLQSGEYILQYNISTRRSQLRSLGSHLDGPASSYDFEVFPFLATGNPTTFQCLTKCYFISE